jgi:hypothetical protein
MKGFVLCIKTLLYLAVFVGLAKAAATVTGIINPMYYYILASENTIEKEKEVTLNENLAYDSLHP